MSGKSTELAAGGLIWRRRTTGTELLLAHRPRYDDWAFPKGKLDKGESLIECARREVEEETGFRCAVGRHLGTTDFTRPDGTDKQVSYWAMEAVGGAFEPNSEVDRVEWVGVERLRDRLSYALDIDFIAGLDPSWTTPPDRILLTRHAHAGDRTKWKGKNDAKRPISKKGRRQAMGLVDQLRPFAIDRIISSPARRCLETVEPLAADRRLPVEGAKELWEESGKKKVARVLRAHGIGSTVMSTHGPNVALAMVELTGAVNPKQMEKGSTWVLDLDGGRVAAASYLSPPEPPS